MLAYLNYQGSGPYPLAGCGRGIKIVNSTVAWVVSVHGIPGRPERRLIGPQVDLPVTHRIERPGLREGLSSMVLQKSILALAEFRHKWQ